MLRFLKPTSRNAPTGLILASALGLQVAAHLAMTDEGTRSSRTFDPSSSTLKVFINTRQNSSLASSTKSRQCRVEIGVKDGLQHEIDDSNVVGGVVEVNHGGGGGNNVEVIGAEAGNSNHLSPTLHNKVRD
jgi:hypothetical protein